MRYLLYPGLRYGLSDYLIQYGVTVDQVKSVIEKYLSEMNTSYDFYGVVEAMEDTLNTGVEEERHQRLPSKENNSHERWIKAL